MLNAVDLFGGMEAVCHRMTESLRPHLRSKTVDELDQWEQTFGLKSGSLSKVALGKQNVEYETFDLVAPTFKLSVYTVLGTPEFNPGTRSSWQEEFKRSPMTLVGTMGAAAPAAMKVTLEMYVKLRAVEELHLGSGMTNVPA